MEIKRYLTSLLKEAFINKDRSLSVLSVSSDILVSYREQLEIIFMLAFT